LIATVFGFHPAGCSLSVQQQSTNLSTAFCGYRKINYIGSFEYYARRIFDALQKLAVGQRFG
jgi:hypothetical protein